MILSRGTHLGPYEILQPIGAGGMGQVYKARDTRLNRTVAIKVLTPEFASRPDWKQRFEREAQTIANDRDDPRWVVYRFVCEPKAASTLSAAGPANQFLKLLSVMTLDSGSQ